MSSQVLLCRVLTSICSLLFLGEISLCGNQKYRQRIVQRGFFFEKKEEAEVTIFSQNKAEFYFFFLLSCLIFSQIWLILMGMIANPKLDNF
jgi:hypothetical protein